MILRFKRPQIISAFSLFLIITLFASCYGSWNFWDDGNDVDERTKELKLLTNEEDSVFAASGISSLSGQYTVLLITDTHFGNHKQDVNCNDLFTWLSSIQGTSSFPAFAICLGDTVDFGKQEEYDLYNDFCNKLKTDYGISVILNSCGNHDIYQSHWDNWEKNCYPHTSFYKFQTQGLSWYSLDSASGTFGVKQYNKMISDFKTDSRKKIIFTHYPFTHFNTNCGNMAETTERNKMISDFANNNVITVLGGHIHRETVDDLGFMVYTIPSFGYKNAWGLLHVDETASTATVEFIGG